MFASGKEVEKMCVRGKNGGGCCQQRCKRAELVLYLREIRSLRLKEMGLSSSAATGLLRLLS